MVLKLLFVLCVIIEIIFVPLFLNAQWPGICRKSLFYKMICSTAFVCAGVLCANIADNKSVYAVMMLAGLCFGWLGDFFLHLSKEQKHFAIGFCNFLIGHIVYIIAYTRTLPIIETDYNPLNLVEIAMGVSLFALTFVLIKVYKVELNMLFLKMGCFVYAILLISMFVKASSLGLNYWLNGGRCGVLTFLVLSLGSLCFLLSDATLGIIMFGSQSKNKPLKVFNIATYFAAQIMLGSSILFINA